MSDIIKHSKKALSTALAITTIVWSVGLFALAPVTVSAAPGDLVKAAGAPAVYLVASDGVTIHPFPHANVYTSWGFPADFSTVMTTNISGFTIGNDVEFRDGSLVRALETPAVYVVSGKKLRPVISAEVFEALGYNYDHITWLPQSFLDKYGATGDMISSTTVHPNGTLVKYAASSTVYVLQNGQRRAFASSDVIRANGFHNTPIITIPASETYPDGAQVVVKESVFTVPTGVGAAPSGPSAPVGSGVSVSLASDTPASSTVIGDTTNSAAQALVPLLKVNITAGSDGAVQINTLKFKRTGISADTNFDGLYLYEGDSVSPSARLTNASSLSSGIATFNNPNGIITVPAGHTKSIMLRADINYAINAGKSFAFEIVSASDVTTNGASVSGVFPVKGNTMSSANVNDLAVIAATNTTSIPASAGAAISAEDDQELWRFTLTSTNQKSEVHYIKMKEVGSVSRTDIKNFTLYEGGNLIGTSAEMTNDYEVIFDLSANPLVLDTGIGKNLVLRGDVVNGATRTFYFSINESADIVSRDTAYNVYVLPYTSGTWAIWGPTPGNYFTISGGELSVTKASDSPSQDVVKDGTNVKLAKYEFRATGEDIRINSLLVGATTTGMAGLKSVRVFVNGVQLDTTRDIAATSSTTTFSFGSTFIAKAGETTNVEIYGDIKKANNTSYADGNTVKIEIYTGSENAQGQTSMSSLSVPGSTVYANELIVKAGALIVNKFSGFGNQTYVAGVNNVRIGSFTLTAGSAEAINVNAVTVTFDEALSYASITDMYLKDNATGTQIGTIRTTPTSSNSYSVNFAVPASGTKVIDVYANVKTGVNAGTITTKIVGTGNGAVTGASVNSGTAQALQIITVGTGALYANNGNHPASDIVIAGNTAVNAGQFTFTAENDSYTITKLQLKTENNFASTTAGVKILVNGTVIGNGVFVASAATPFATATFTGLNISVPAGQSVNMDVQLDTVSLASSGASGANGKIYLVHNAGFEATNSGAALTSLSAERSGNLMYIRKTKPTFTRVALSGTPISGADLIRFNVVADSAGNVEIKQMTFTVSTVTVKATGFKLYEDGVAVTTSAVDGNTVTLLVGAATGATGDNVINVGTTPKTISVRADTVSGWATGATLSIRPTVDASPVATGSSAGLIGGHNLVWSDRSVSNHTTVSADWTNGYLLKDLDTVQSF